MEELAPENTLRELTAENSGNSDSMPAAATGRWERLRIVRPRLSSAARERIFVGVELLIVILWALLVTRPYQDMNPDVIPAGREYLSAIQTHHVWTNAVRCGWCALWNGSVAGGAPAFADPYGSMLHPLVIATTLGWGVLNGAKLALVGAFIMGGLAQWWLARVLGLGRLARVWTACMAVAGGHLAGRMGQGTFGMVLSTAACALALPPLVMLIRTGSRRAAVLLGVTLGLALLAGQGYMQVGLLLLFPAALLAAPGDQEHFRLLLRRLALALALGLLLAGPFLMPFLHFLPQFEKDGDPNFGSGQPLAAVPLNLVIDDPSFYTNTTLHKLPFPYLYINFVGWFAVLLALWGVLAPADREQRRVTNALGLFAVLALWIGSGSLFVLLTRLIPFPTITDRLASIRYYPMIAGLAVPPLLGLAGVGLERIWRAKWVLLRIAVGTSDATARPFSVDLRWLLVILMVVSLRDAKVFGANWLATIELSPVVETLLESLRTSDLQWVNPPHGDHIFIEPAVRLGLKMSSGFRTWRWHDRPSPEPVRVLEINKSPPDMTTRLQVAGIPLYEAGPGREYAALTQTDGGRSICSADGVGGDLVVRCNAPREGALIVKENSWAGWRAWVDGQPATLLPGRWLSVEISGGDHTVEFRYLPWDVPLGLLLALAGIALAVSCWFKPDANAAWPGLTPPTPPTPS